MNDAVAMQRCHGAGQFDRDVSSFFQSQRRASRKPRFQEFSLVERHYGIKAGLASRWQFDDTAEPGIVDPRADPSLADKCCAISVDAGELRFGELQGDATAFDFVLSGEEPGVAPVRN